MCRFSYYKPMHANVLDLHGPLTDLFPQKWQDLQHFQPAKCLAAAHATAAHTKHRHRLNHHRQQRRRRRREDGSLISIL